MGDREKAFERFGEYLDDYLNVKIALEDAVASDIPIHVVADMANEMAHDLYQSMLKALTPEEGVSIVMLPVMELVTRNLANAMHMAYEASDKALDEAIDNETPDQFEELYRRFWDEMEG